MKKEYENFLTSEKILRQTIGREYLVTFKDYDLDSMIQIASLFNELNSLLYELTFDKKINMSKLIRVFLDEAYSDEVFERLLECYKREVNKRNKCISICSGRITYQSPGKTIRDRLEEIKQIIYNNFPEYCIDYVQETKRKYYVPLYFGADILVLFSFIDGRSFLSVKKNCPRSNNSYIKRYEIGTNIGLNWIKKVKAFEAGKFKWKRELTVASKYKMENLLYKDRMHGIVNCWKTYTNRATGNGVYVKFCVKICSSRNIYGSEQESIYKLIDEIFFRDYDFLLTGLKSGLLDVMYPFEIEFGYFVLRCHMPFSTVGGGEKRLEEDLKEIKEKVRIVWMEASEIIEKQKSNTKLLLELCNEAGKCKDNEGENRSQCIKSIADSIFSNAYWKANDMNNDDTYLDSCESEYYYELIDQLLPNLMKIPNGT